MGKVTNLNAAAVTPAQVIDGVTNELDQIKDVYVVAINHDGTHTMWGSGKLDTIERASLILSYRATKIAVHGVEHE